MSTRHRLRLITTTFFFMVLSLTMSVCLAAVTNTWTGNTDTDWFTGGNWSDGVPAAGQHVVITNVATQVLLTNSTANLASFVIISNTLTFTNWTTALNASNVTIQSGATLTLPVAFTNNVMSNRVHIVCTNFMLDSGGTIDADGGGYKVGDGPGAGQVSGLRGSGAGYGGRGGDNKYLTSGGAPYGLTNAPVQPGSSGGHINVDYPGGPGGGAVRIEAINVTINGMITADGENSGNYAGGGGSGGGIYMTCETFGGNGILCANGGNGGSDGGGGGGGRIAVDYGSISESNEVRFSTSPGTGWADSQPVYEWWQYVAGMGTLYLPDTALLLETLDQFTDVRLMFPGFTSWDVASLTISTGVVAFADGNFRLRVTNDMVIQSGGSLSLGARALKGWVSESAPGQATNPLSVGGSVILNGGTLSLGGFYQGSKTVVDVGENLTLTNGASLHVCSGITNGVEDYGALVTVTGDVSIAKDSWIYPYSNPTNGGSVLFRVNDLVTSTNAGFNADYRGYTAGYGPGKGVIVAGSGVSGSGYGGKGGDGGTVAGGSTYGSTNAPIDPGSGGAYNASYPSGTGGGVVRIKADGDVTVNGTISANGGDSSGYGASASGGGIFITCKMFGGSTNGILRANGGSHTVALCGGGGGGRIAVWYGVPEDRIDGIIDGTDMRRVFIITNASDYSEFSGMVSVTNGTDNDPAEDGKPGTIVFLTVTPPSGTMFMCQ